LYPSLKKTKLGDIFKPAADKRQ